MSHVPPFENSYSLAWTLVCVHSIYNVYCASCVYSIYSIYGIYGTSLRLVMKHCPWYAFSADSAKSERDESKVN